VSGGLSLPLLADGALRLDAHAAAVPLLARWLPRVPRASGDDDDARAVLRVAPAVSAVPADGEGDARPSARGRGRRTLRLGNVAVWVAGDGAHLEGRAAPVRGGVDLAAGRAALGWDEGADPHAAADALYSMATVSSALLLGRLGRALVHAAAVVAPDGRAWLLAGDTHAGKTTTCVNLLAAGWRYVSDDHVVLSAEGATGGVIVEGWPRAFHLDEGWEDGAPTGRRGELDAAARWPGRWLRTAPLGGCLFPRVQAGEATALLPAAPADALAALVRQSPWLLADRAAAPAVMSLLQRAAAAPAYGLRLGLDTYRDRALLVRRLAPAVGAAA
jgi:hypothetical protein